MRGGSVESRVLHKTNDGKVSIFHAEQNSAGKLKEFTFSTCIIQKHHIAAQSMKDIGSSDGYHCRASNGRGV